jgi:hypothetical protein
MPKMRVNEKALAHLSRGLYRSPASALRELISNAWDANATEVLIDSNAPSFAQLTVQDNGDGFSEDAFVRLMEGGIGNSEKRPKEAQLLYGRPLIGRLGIGMLGIAQICGAFTITSKTKEGAAFRANVTLYDLIREKLDSNDATVVQGLDEENRPKEVDVGEYKLEANFDGSSLPTGTTITSNDVHPTFSHTFRETYQQPPLRWAEFLKRTSKKHSIQELGDYWRLLWELGASCPLPYVSPDAVPKGAVVSEQARLKDYRFRVVVDGIELRKPVRLQGNKGGYTVRVIAEESHRVFGKDVKFHGYIAVQEGTQLRPDELRGIMVRVTGVGVGLYDTSMLDYRYNEGPRSRWVTGEVFVTAGLDNALNIDRDSFNRFHPEFRVVQRRVHEILHREIFPAVYKQIEVRSNARQKQKDVSRRALLKRVFGGAAADVRVRRESAGDKGGTPTVRARGQRLEISLPAPGSLPTKKAQQQLAASILAIFEVALLERTVEERRRIFRDRLLELLEEW